MTAGRAGRWWLLALVVLPSLLVLLWALGLGGALSPDALEERQAELRALAAAHPVLAPLGFTGIYVVAVALSVPGAEVLTLAGGLLFGTVLGSLCTVVGATAGATALFLLARTALGGLLAGRAGGLLTRVRPGLERDGLSYLLALRLLPVVPFWLVNLAAALVPMRLGAFVLGTAVGIVPATVVFSAAGAGLGQVLAAGGEPELATVLRPGVVLPLVGLAVLAMLPVAWRRLRGSAPGTPAGKALPPPDPLHQGPAGPGPGTPLRARGETSPPRAEGT